MIIDKEIAIEIIKNGRIFITCVNSEVHGKLEGKIIAEDIVVSGSSQTF